MPPTMQTVDALDIIPSSAVSATFYPTYQLFINSVNADIKIINEGIEAFNALPPDTPPEGRLLFLNKIYALQQEMNNRYPMSIISACKGYQTKIHKNLRDQLVEQFKTLGFPSLYHGTLPVHGPSNPSQLPEMIASMPQNIFDKFIAICWSDPLNIATKLLSLYNRSNPVEYNPIETFVNTHEIRIISAVGNSRNIWIKPPSQQPVVLKIDARRGQPKLAEMALRMKGFSYLTRSLGEERQGTAILNPRTLDALTATVVITDFCPGGDLKTNAKKNHQEKKSPAEMIASALNYYRQMATTMQELQAKGFAFPDAKNANWLIDDKDQLKIADTKSFLFIEPPDTLNPEAANNQWLSVICSPTHVPKELQEKKIPCSTNKLHTYMLGKNLYQYLTYCDTTFLVDKVDPTHPYYSKFQTIGAKRSFSDDDFTQTVINNQMCRLTVFNAPGGQALKALIQQMVQPDPAARITIEEAIRKIDSIKAWLNDPNRQAIVKECLDIIVEMDKLTPADDDIMKSYLKANQAKLEYPLLLQDLQVLKIELAAYAHEINTVKTLPFPVQGAFKRAAISERVDFCNRVCSLEPPQTFKDRLQQVTGAQEEQKKPPRP